jgi:hypothetical protein
MDYQASAWQRWRLATIGVLLFGLACADTGGDGCGGCGLGSAVPYDPNGSIIEHAVQVRLSEPGLSWLEDNGGPLVGGLLGDQGLSFCLEPQTIDLGIGEYEICNDPSVNMCDAETPGCLFDPAIAGIELTPTDGGGAASDSLAVTILLNLNEDISTSTCPGLNLSSPALPVNLDVVFHINGPSDLGEEGRTWVEVLDIGVNFGAVVAGPSSFVTNPLEQVSCGLLAAAVGGLGGTIAPLLTGPIEDTVADALCTPCGSDGSCPGEAYCGGDPEVCRWDVAGSPCVPLALGTEGVLPLAALLADFAPQLENDLSYLAYAADFADAENDGMTLAAEVGVYAPHDLCVPDVPGPATTPIPHSAGLVSDVRPDGEPFMFGIGIGRRAIDLALWSAYRSGALCLAVGSETVEQLSSGALAVFVPGLNDLTEGQSVPVILVTRPTQPLTANLGSGAVEPGETVPSDPALAIEAREFKLDFYFFMEERFARVFTLDTDFSLPIILEPSDDGTGIQIVLDSDILSGLFTRVEAENAGLLAPDDLDALVELLPGLIGVAAGPLQDAVGEPFALPELGGYRLALDANSFTSIDDETMLAIFADLEAAPASGTATAEFAPSAVAELAALLQPSPEEIAEFEALRDRGGIVEPSALQSELVLRVDTLGARPGEAREYAYRIDGGIWRGYETPEAGLLRLRDPELLLEGTRVIEVRSRIADQPGTLSLPSAPVAITVDLASPQAVVERLDEGHLTVRAWDSITAEADLLMWYRFDGGDWVETAVEEPIALPESSASGRNAVDVEVQVEDAAGRSRLVTRTFAIHGRTTNTDTGGDDGCGGCSTSGGGNGLGWWALLGLLGARSLRRESAEGRSQRPSRLARALPVALALALLAALVLTGAGCGDDAPPANGQGGGDDCGDACTADQVCEEGVCIDVGGCSEDDDCADGQVCEGSECVVGDTCDGDVDCPAGQFCLDGDEDGRTECVSVPCTDNAGCGDLTCAGGRLPYCIADSCMCEFPCADGCGDDEYCCNATNSCEDVPNVCAPLDCEIGFGPAVIVPAGGDPNTCRVTGPECECRELPPLPMGDIGSFMGAAADDDGTIYVSAFNRTYEDLMVGVVQDDGSVSWEFVDGLPDTGAVTGSLNGPRGGIAVGGPRVGRYSDIAVGTDGALHVSYYDGLSRTLRYAHGAPSGGGFEWTFQPVDETPRTGTYSSITLSPAGVPAIAYFAERVEGEPGVWTSEVRVAWADAAEPTAWTIDIASSVVSTFPCGGLCTGTTRCHAEANRCENTARDSECEPECEGDLECFEGPDGNRCGTRETDIPANVLLPEGSGIFIDSIRTTGDEVALVWYDRARGNLMFNQSAGRSFAATVPTLVDGETPEGDDTGDVGWYPTLATDGAAGLHVTYVNATNDWLMYFALSGGSGRAEIVDNGVRGIGATSGRVLVGDDSSIIVLDDGTIQVAYQDMSQHYVLVRQRTPAGSWVAPEVVAGNETPYDGAFGFYLQQIATADGTYVLTYRIHTAEGVRDVVALPLD